MTSSPASPSVPSSPRPPKPGQLRLFYLVSALLLLVAMLWGFQDFYFRGQSYPGRPTPPPIKLPVILHGVTMAMWVALFIIQTALIARRNYKVHMLLGSVGVVLAVLIVIFGTWLAIESTRITPPQFVIWTLSPRQFFAVPCSGMLLFAVFAALGICCRKKPAIHKPMMLLASLAVISAAIARITPLSDLYVGTQWEVVFGPFLGIIVFAALLVIAKSLLTRSLDRWFIGGFALLTAVSLLTMPVAKTPAWAWFTDLVVR